MTLTKTTTRALAASVAIVSAGAMLAGAAVFHLPVLGFHSVAAASEPQAHGYEHPVARHAVRPIAVVRVRYVDDIVHRPAPASAYSVPRAVAQYPAPRAAATFVSRAPQPVAVIAPQLTSPAASHYGEAEHEPVERDAPDHVPSRSQHSTTTVGGSNAGDQ
jgi:hypothetical protein